MDARENKNNNENINKNITDTESTINTDTKTKKKKEKKVKEKVKTKEKKEKKEKKKNENRVSVKGMFAEIEAYGYEYSFKKFLLRLVVVWGIIGVAAYFYTLKIVPIILLIILCTALTPLMVKAQFKYKYEHDKFNDVNDYLQQIGYSFLKTKKIRNSLEEVVYILNGRKICNAINKAIDYIDNAQSETLFEDALAIIEEEYGCEKMHNLHNFFIKVEKEGGAFESTLGLMMSDIQEWTQRTYIYQKKRKAVQSAVLMSIIMSLVMCGVLNMYIPDNIPFQRKDGGQGAMSLAIYGSIIYQIASTIFLGIMVGIYTITQTAMQGSWLADKGTRKEKAILKDYKYYVHFDLKQETMKYAVWALVFGLVAAVTYFILHQNGFAAVFAFTALYYITFPKRKLRSTKKRLERDLQKAFPDWVRDVSISLNTQTVQNAIIMSYEKAPVVLKPAIRKLIKDFTEDPVTYKPWADFLDEFDVPEAKSAARMFYSINELSGDKAKEQIDTLIKRNARLVREADEKKAEDEITTLGYMVVLPMGISIFKLLIDLFLLILQFVNITDIISQMT